MRERERVCVKVRMSGRELLQSGLKAFLLSKKFSHRKIELRARLTYYIAHKEKEKICK